MRYKRIYVEYDAATEHYLVSAYVLDPTAPRGASADERETELWTRTFDRVGVDDIELELPDGGQVKLHIGVGPAPDVRFSRDPDDASVCKIETKSSGPDATIGLERI